MSRGRINKNIKRQPYFLCLRVGGVFPEQLIKNFIAMKRKECAEMAKIPHPAEFDKYFNL